MREPRIRRAVEADWESLLTIETSCFGSTSYSRYFMRMVPLLQGFEVLVASDESEPIGYCMGAFETPSKAWLMSIAVLPKAGGRGVGTALCRAFLSEIELRGGQAVYLTAEPNGPALRLYRRLGFVPVLEDSSFYGAGHPRVIMVRELAALAESK